MPKELPKRVEENLLKMLAQDASDEEIEEYMTGEGFPPVQQAQPGLDIYTQEATPPQNTSPSNFSENLTQLDKEFASEDENRLNLEAASHAAKAAGLSFIEPFYRHAKSEFKSGVNLEREGFNQLLNSQSTGDVFKGLGKTALGVMQAGFAPVSSPFMVFADAVNSGADLARDASKDTALEFPVNFALGPKGATGEIASLIAGLASPKMLGNALKNFLGFPIDETAALVGAGGQIPGKVARGMAPSAVSNAGLASKFLDPKDVLRQSEPGFQETIISELARDIATAAKPALEGNFSKSERLFKQVSRLLQAGEIESSFIPEILKKHDLSLDQFAQEYAASISESARNLKSLSDLKKQLNAIYPKGSAGAKALGEKLQVIQDQQGVMGRTLDGLRSIENVARASLISQSMTAMRNLTSFGARMTLSTVDEALQSVLRKTFGGKREEFDTLRNNFTQLTGILQNMPFKKNQQLLDLLDSKNGVLAKARLLSEPVHDVKLGKYTKMITVFNRVQENFSRKMAFEARMRQNLNRAGMKFEDVDPNAIPEELFQDAVDYSLEMTFAQHAKSEGVRKTIRGFKDFLGTMAIPFPNFVAANAIPFMFDHSPLGFLHLAKPTIIREMASGNPERFARHMSRAAIGTMMLDAAMQVRANVGEEFKWYEYPAEDGKVIDARVFAPFSTMLFVAEAIQHPEKISAREWIELGIGLNRVAGTGLELVDILRGADSKLTIASIERFIGAYGGRFTTPIRTAKDLVGDVIPEEKSPRTTRENPIIGPTIKNIPGLSQLLPEYRSGLDATDPAPQDAFGVPGGVLRQLSGLSAKNVSPIQKEMNRLNIKDKSLIGRTGIAEADTKLRGIMGVIGDEILADMIQSSQYKALNKPEQRLLFEEKIHGIRKAARNVFAAREPNLDAKIRLFRKLTQAMRQNITEETGEDSRKITDQIVDDAFESNNIPKRNNLLDILSAKPPAKVVP